MINAQFSMFNTAEVVYWVKIYLWTVRKKNSTLKTDW